MPGKTTAPHGHARRPRWPGARFALPGLSGVIAWAATAGHAAAQDRPLPADFEEVYRAGGLGAPEWALFTDPGRMGFDAAGNLYVLDGGAYRITVIGSGGDLVRIVGRQGEGPGEFRSASDIVVWRDGRCAVVDIGHLAYQLFGPDGEIERFVRMSSAAGALGMGAARERSGPTPPAARSSRRERGWRRPSFRRMRQRSKVSGSMSSAKTGNWNGST